MNRFQAMRYTWEHKKAFLQVEKELLGYNTLRGYLHDIDKLILYPVLGKARTSNFHRKHSKHHYENVKTEADIVQLIIDWECARYTKPDKPFSAREYLDMNYPDDGKGIKLILDILKL